MTRYQRLASHLRVIPVPGLKGRRYFVFDLIAKCELRHLSAYAHSMKTLSPLTIEKALLHVTRVYEYVRVSGIPFEAFSDTVLKGYRDWELEKTKVDKSYRGNVQAAKRTVNEKLDSILKWLSWMKSTGRVAIVDVTFPYEVSDGRNRPHRRRPKSGVYFEGTGAKSKHKSTVMPSKAKRQQIAERILENPKSSYVAHRDTLLLKLISSVGFRIGSVNSLLVDQFHFNVEENSELDSIVVVPSSQKFGQAHEYAVPIELAYLVKRFNEEYRLPLIKSRNAGRDLSEGRLFLSYKDARPMRNGSFSKTFGCVMRSVGLGKGNAVHILRKVFGTDATEVNIAQRMRYGMDSSARTVAASVAMQLKQKNPDSTRPYVLRAGDEVRMKVAQAEENENKRLKEKLASAREENDRLRAELAARPPVNSSPKK